MEAKKKILIVDDDVELANLLAQAVSDVSNEYDVRVANDVDGAMVLVNKAQLAEDPFDLVITDIKMLGLSGLELLEALESIAPDTKTITMTAFNSPELAERAQELNVYAYLTKPFVLSEFRQIVRSALYPALAEESKGQEQPAYRLPTAQKAAVTKHLATLRAMTGTSAALLIHSSGSLLASDTQETDIDASRLCEALIYAQQVIGEQMAETLATDSPIRQCYFGTETFSICTYRLDDAHVLAVIFGPAVREGQVWYYMRDAVSRVKNALTPPATPSVARATETNDVFDMLDQFFPNQRSTRPDARPSRAALEADQNVAQHEPKPVQPASPQAEHEPVLETKPPPLPTAPSTDLPAIDDIDWSVSPDADWDEIAADTDQGFAGMSIEEARSRGLLPPELLESLAPQEQTASSSPEDAEVNLEDLELDADIGTTWDEIAATTDQGFDGMSFEEARRLGLIGDIQTE